MRRIRFGCCARAASGHAAAPPSSVINSRRFTARWPPVLLEDSTPWYVRQETAACGILVLQRVNRAESDEGRYPVHVLSTPKADLSSSFGPRSDRLGSKALRQVQRHDTLPPRDSLGRP